MTKKNRTKATREAEKLLSQALQWRREERYADAKRDLEQAIGMFQKSGARFTLARSLAMLGQIERDQKKVDAALECYEEALKIFRELADTGRVAHTVRHIADIQRSVGRLSDAEQNYTEALKIYSNSQQTSPLDLANTVRGLALLKEDLHALGEARLLWQEATELYETVGVPEGVAECKQRLAGLDLAKK